MDIHRPIRIVALAIFSMLLSHPMATQPVFKSVTEAMYYAKREGEKTREDALKDHLYKIEEFESTGELAVSRQFKMSGELLEKIVFGKRQNGQQKATSYNTSGNLESYWIKIFDRNGNEIEKKSYAKNDELRSVESKKYNADNTVSHYVNDNKEFGYRTTETYQYDANGLAVEESVETTSRRGNEKRINTYDAKRNRISTKIERETGTKTFLLQYDESNNLTLQKGFDADGKLTIENSFSYVYDSHGNWITRKRYLNNELDFVWERAIEYYR